jgi:hypothetical protein
MRETWVEPNIEGMKTCSNARGHENSCINSMRDATIHGHCFEASHRSGGLYVVEGDVVDQAYSHDRVRIDQRIQRKVDMPLEPRKRLTATDPRGRCGYINQNPNRHSAPGHLPKRPQRPAPGGTQPTAQRPCEARSYQPAPIPQRRPTYPARGTWSSWDSVATANASGQAPR